MLKEDIYHFVFFNVEKNVKIVLLPLYKLVQIT